MSENENENELVVMTREELDEKLKLHKEWINCNETLFENNGKDLC